MKTEKFYLIRIFCRIFIIVLILSSLSYTFLFFFNKSIFSVENTISMGSMFTLRSFSLHMIFSSIFIPLICGYALNIGSRGLASVGMWLSIFLCLYCIFAIGYMKIYGVSNCINTFKLNPYSTDINPYFLMSIFGVQDIIKAEKMFTESYEKLFYYFSVFGMINIVGLILLSTGLLTVVFVKIHKEEVEEPTIETTVVENLASLRGRTAVSVR